MATEKQIAANRLNAALSTGPKTDEGKAQSRANAMTHSLTAVTLMPRDRNISITPVRATRVCSAQWERDDQTRGLDPAFKPPHCPG